MLIKDSANRIKTEDFIIKKDVRRIDAFKTFSYAKQSFSTDISNTLENQNKRMVGYLPNLTEIVRSISESQVRR